MSLVPYRQNTILLECSDFYRQIIWKDHSVSEQRLYIGSRFTGFAVRPDTQWPSMWRVHGPDGRVSDIVNLTRAKDAAVTWARPRGLGGDETVRWHHRETALVAPPAASNEIRVASGKRHRRVRQM